MIESIGSFRIKYGLGPNPHQLWIMATVVPPFNQGRDEFYKCIEGLCGVKFGNTKKDAKRGPSFIWTRSGTSFFFRKKEDLEYIFHAARKGFTREEELELLIKRKLILGSNANDRFIL